MKDKAGRRWKVAVGGLVAVCLLPRLSPDENNLISPRGRRSAIITPSTDLQLTTRWTRSTSVVGIHLML